MDQVKRNREVSTQFVTLYNTLDGWMRNILKVDNGPSFASVLREMAKKYPVIDKHFKYLQDMADVRNLVEHTRMDDGVGLVVPTQDVVDDFSRLVDMIMDPPALYKEAAKNLKIHKYTDPLSVALSEMKEHDFSQLVVQDQKGTHRLITREGIAKWLEESIEDDVVSIRETTIEQVLRCEDKEACCFLPRNANIFEGLQKFSNPEKRIQALVLTQTGREEEKPVGLVTAYDIARIASSSA